MPAAGVELNGFPLPSTAEQVGAVITPSGTAEVIHVNSGSESELLMVTSAGVKSTPIDTLEAEDEEVPPKGEVIENGSDGAGCCDVEVL